MRIGFLVKQLNKSEDVLDDSVKIVRDEMRDYLNYFIRARNFSGAPGKIGLRFFLYPLRVKPSHLFSLLTVDRFPLLLLVCCFLFLRRATRKETRAGAVPCPE